MKITQSLNSDGIITKDGKNYEVPWCNWGPTHYPMPSECNYWISLFKNLRDNFTDTEIEEINNKILDRETAINGR